MTFAGGSVRGHIPWDGDGTGVEGEVVGAAEVVDVTVGPHLEEGHRVPADEEEEGDWEWHVCERVWDIFFALGLPVALG